MKGRSKWIRYGVLGILTVVLTVSMLWQFNQGNGARAAGGIIISGDAGTGEYQIRQRDVVASIDDVPLGTEVTWITDPDVVRFVDIVTSQEITTATHKTGSTVRLRAVGLTSSPISITASYISGGSTITISREVSVPTAIKEDANNGFGTIRSGMESVMILELGESGTLEMLYDPPAGTSVRWESRNTDVISMAQNSKESYNITGGFWAVGTGKTTITVLYSSADGKQLSSSVDVYVGPKIDVDGNAPDNSGNSIAYRDSQINVGVDMASKTEPINNKIDWFLTNEAGDTILQSSTVGSSQYLSSALYQSYLTVRARAGTYQLYVFTSGIYQGIEDFKDASISNKVKKMITLKVVPETDRIATQINLQTQDSYDFAEILNMNTEDFNKYFTATVGNVLYGNVTNGVFTADNLEGTTTVDLKLTEQGKAALASYFHGSIDVDYSPRITIHIYKGFYLDRSAVQITVGGSLSLKTLYGGTKGIITWKSSDDTSVKVTQGGDSTVITGVKATGDKEIIVTASMLLADGRTLKATCAVKVDVSATKIILSDSNLRLRIGDPYTLSAKFEPSSITTANLQWLTTDPNVADIQVNSPISVIITGKNPGTTILTAVNTDNYVMAYCTITVMSSIENLTLNHTLVTMTMSQDVLKLRATYQPSNATETNLSWSSNDTSVATVDSTGLVTFKAPGTCLITVMPTWNPNNVMAQCYITVIASPTAFALDRTTLTLEVGAKETIKPVLTAPNSTTTITWRTMDSKIASVNGEGVVTAVASGQTYIIASTKEGFVANCLVTVTQKASGISLDTYNIKIAVGETYTVKATPNPATSTERTFTWASTDPKIASVKDGVVTGVSSGSTIVEVKTKTAGVTLVYVEVYDKAKGMTLNYDNKELAKGSTFKLKPIFTPANVSNAKVEYKSLNTKVATVNSSGTVKGNSGGAVVITCISEDGGYMATCLVMVVEPITNIKLNYSTYNLGLNKSITLKATVTSNTSSNPKVKWTSSNASVVSVNSSGKITGKKVGTATITATATDGSKKKATSRIKVVRQVTSMSMNKPILTLMVGKTQKLKATIKPSNATYKTAKWTSSDTSVAIVDSAGNVTGLSVGTSTIKAAAKDNSKQAVTCYVNVIDPIPVTGIVLAAKDIILINGQSEMISYTTTPSNNTDKIMFASSNKAIATVSGTGKITARRTGNATITLTASASGKQAVINVTIIGLNKTKVTLEQYDTETLLVEGVSTPVTWYSGNPSIATVVNGKIVARKKGSTNIYAKVSGITLSCQVTVKDIK